MSNQSPHIDENNDTEATENTEATSLAVDPSSDGSAPEAPAEAAAAPPVEEAASEPAASDAAASTADETTAPEAVAASGETSEPPVEA